MKHDKKPPMKPQRDPYAPTAIHDSTIREMILLLCDRDTDIASCVPVESHDAIVRAMMRELCAWRKFSKADETRIKGAQGRIKDLVAAVRWVAGAFGQTGGTVTVGSKGPCIGASEVLMKVASDFESACYFDVQYPRWRDEVNPVPEDSVRMVLDRHVRAKKEASDAER